VPSRNGFTLVETLIVVVLLGLMTLIAFPKMSAAMVRNDVRSARTTVINLVAQARTVAAQSSRLTWVKFEGNTAHVLARPRRKPGGGAPVDLADTVGTIHNLAQDYRVTVTVTPAADSIRFDPRGFGSGFGGVPTSIVLSRDGYSSTITIDGLGRVTK
jgi:prepilin-type N-terminal cleavage/methylation domain-containing protein